MSATNSRRTLRFENLDQAIADARSLAELEQAGRIKAIGNWTLGQSLNHLACWVDYGYDGAPLKVPLVIRLIMRPLKSRILHKSMRAGTRIPGVKDGTLATDPAPTGEALPHFVRGFERLKTESPGRPSPLFGELSHAEWIALHLRHAELHLSFLTLA
jgi:hypothetical protein